MRNFRENLNSPSEPKFPLYAELLVGWPGLLYAALVFFDMLLSLLFNFWGDITAEQKRAILKNKLWQPLK